MTRNVCIIQGHPHRGAHLCHALADAYARGAAGAGAEVVRLDVAALAPAPLSDPADFATPPQGPMAVAREAVRTAEHLVILFPLWLGTMPALLKAFFEQLSRADFAASVSEGGWPEKKLRGRSARIVVTMGMPALAYRLMFGAAGVRCLRGGILWMAGIAPVRTSYVGSVDALGEKGVARWRRRMEALGAEQR